MRRPVTFNDPGTIHALPHIFLDRVGERLVEVDDAHPVARQTRSEPQDHRHRLRAIKACEHRDAATLLSDFWSTVDAVLRERGVIP